MRTIYCRSRLSALSLFWSLWHVKEHTPLFEKRKGCRPQWFGRSFLRLSWSPVRWKLTIGITSWSSLCKQCMYVCMYVILEISRWFSINVTSLDLHNSSDHTQPHPIIAFVRTHPNLGVPMVQSDKFSRYRGRLPINRLHWFYQGHLSRETGLLLTQCRFRKWRTRIRNKWLPLVDNC